MRLAVFALMVVCIFATPYDPKNHQSGHELEVSLREADNVIFVIMWYRSDAEGEVPSWNSKNKTAIDAKITDMSDASFSMVDMSIEDHQKDKPEDYTKVFEAINGQSFDDWDEYLTKDGPVVNVLRKGKGVRITGKGIADEVLDEATEMQANIEADKAKASSSGASSAADAQNDSGSDDGSSEDDENDTIPKSTEATQGSYDDVF